MNRIKKVFDKAYNLLEVNYFVYKIVVLVLSILFLNIFVLSHYASPVYGYNHVVIVYAFFICLWFVLPRYFDKAFYLISLFGYTTYLVTQKIYMMAFNQYYTFKTVFSMYKEAIGAKSSAFELVRIEDYLVLIAFVVLAIIVLMIHDDRKMNRKIKVLTAFVIFSISFILIYNRFDNFNRKLSTASVDKLTYNESDLYLYKELPSSMTFVNKFGIEAFLIRDINETFFVPLSDDHDEKEAAIIAFLDSMNTTKSTNEMTGIFEGKNLIIIQGESLMNVAIDPTLTPTLYKMRNEGYWFSEYDSPLLTGSTSDTEILVQMSIHPIAYGMATMNNFADNTFNISLPKLFKTREYSTTIYHNNYASYYNRDIFYSNNYYDKFYTSTDMGLENQTSDMITLEYASWILAEKKNVFAYFIAYSGHQPYTLESLNNNSLPESTAEEYRNYINVINDVYPKLTETMKVYLAKCMSLDRGIEKLMIALDVYGKLDDTVFLVFGDHYAKGVSTNNAKIDNDLQLLNKDDSTSVPLIIYNSQTPSLIIDKYCSSIDILPTIANMFNLPYQYKYVFGFDIFSDDYVGYSYDANGSIYSENFTYDYENGLQISGDISENAAKEIIDYFIDTKEISEYIIELDYFKTIK